MLTFIKMEFLKLKRSKIFLLSILMAALPSVLMFIATSKAKKIQDILIEHTYGCIAFNFNVYCNICF